jgi:hypothetical protein
VNSCGVLNLRALRVIGPGDAVGGLRGHSFETPLVEGLVTCQRQYEPTVHLVAGVGPCCKERDDLRTAARVTNAALRRAESALCALQRSVADLRSFS